VLFTDIVGSTARAAELGDARWRALLRDHHRVIRGLLRRHHGREVDTAGDGFFATFAQPADAIACAIEAADAVARLGIEIRAGIHTGEVEPMGKKVGGIAVHLGARILGVAEPGQILVSSTVRDLVTGAGFTFTDVGPRELKGVADAWHVYAVERPAPPEAQQRVPAEPLPGSSPATQSRVLIGVAAASLVAATAAVVFVLARGGPGPSDEVGANRLQAVMMDGELGATLGVGRGPSAVTSDGDSLWVANTFGGTVSRVDSTTGEEAVVGAGIPGDITVSDGLVWALDSFQGVALVISREDATILQTIPVHGRAIAANDEAVWLADDLSDVVHRIDPSRRAVEASIALAPGSAPSAIAATDDAVWVANFTTMTVTRIDPRTNEVAAEAIALPAPPSAIAASTGAIWVASEADDLLIRLDPESGRVISQEAVCDGPTDLVVIGDAVVATCPAGHEVWRLIEGQEPVRTPIDGVPVGVAAIGDEVWVTVRES